MRRSSLPKLRAALSHLHSGCDSSNLLKDHSIALTLVKSVPQSSTRQSETVARATLPAFKHFHSSTSYPQLRAASETSQPQRIRQTLQSRGAKKKPRFAEAEGDEAIEQDVDLEGTQKAMAASLERLQSVLATVRTGRAAPGLIENLNVEVYGDRVPLRSLGAISVRDAQTLLVTPWDKGTVAGIARAISESPLSLSPRQEGAEVIVPVPKPSKELVAGMNKMVKQEAESSRVAIRQARRQAVDQAKAIVSKNDKSRAERKVQELTDDYINKINQETEAKEAELAAIV